MMLVRGIVTTVVLADCSAGDLAHVGQGRPRRPHWDTFRTEKLKVFWAFLGVQIPSAPPIFTFVQVGGPFTFEVQKRPLVKVLRMLVRVALSTRTAATRARSRRW
jgi:hypothetical protein